MTDSNSLMVPSTSTSSGLSPRPPSTSSRKLSATSPSFSWQPQQQHHHVPPPPPPLPPHYYPYPPVHAGSMPPMYHPPGHNLPPSQYWNGLPPPQPPPWATTNGGTSSGTSSPPHPYSYYVPFPLPQHYQYHNPPPFPPAVQYPQFIPTPQPVGFMPDDPYAYIEPCHEFGPPRPGRLRTTRLPPSTSDIAGVTIRRGISVHPKEKYRFTTIPAVLEEDEEDTEDVTVDEEEEEEESDIEVILDLPPPRSTTSASTSIPPSPRILETPSVATTVLTEPISTAPSEIVPSSSASSVVEASSPVVASAEVPAPEEPVIEDAAPPAPVAKPAKMNWAALFQKPASGSSSSQLPAAKPASTVSAASTTNGDLLPLTTLLASLDYSSVQDSTTGITPRGLVNNGNMCFANAILQVLVFTAPFRELLGALRTGTKRDLRGDAFLGRGAIDAMISFLDEFLSPPLSVLPTSSSTPLTNGDSKLQPPPAFAPTLIYSSLKSNPRFSAMQQGTQEDAEEFLGFYLETLHEEVVKALEAEKENGVVPKVNGVQSPKAGGDEDEGWLEVGAKGRAATTRTTESKESPITKIFGGRLKSVLRCQGHKDSITLEPYQRLQLDIQPNDVRTVEDALAHLTTQEIIPDYKPSRAVKQVLLDALPPILVLHLKRFLYDPSGGGVQKFGKRVEFGTELLVKGEWCAGAGKGGKGARYVLYAVVYHHGRYATGGHYTVSVRQDALSDSQNKNWIHIDDTQIKPASADGLVGSASGVGIDDDEKVAYLLFYRRVDA